MQSVFRVKSGLHPCKLHITSSASNSRGYPAVSVRNHITPQPDIIGACAHLAKHAYYHAPFVNFDSLCTVMGLHQSMELADTQVLKLLEYLESAC